MALELYYAPESCAFAAIVALEQAKAEYRLHRLDLTGGDQRSARYLALNPLGRVPVLVADGEPVTELLAVLSYIAARFPQAELLPFADPLLLAKAYELLSWFSTSFHGYVAQVFRGDRFTDDAAVREALKEPGRRNFAAQLPRLEATCAASGGGLVGDRFTAVDAFSLVIWRWAEKLGIDTSDYSCWRASVARDSASPAVVRAVAAEAAGQLWLDRVGAVA